MYVLRQICHWDLEFVSQARLASQQSPEILFSPQCWNHKHVPPCPNFCAVGVGNISLVLMPAWWTLYPLSCLPSPGYTEFIESQDSGLLKWHTCHEIWFHGHLTKSLSFHSPATSQPEHWHRTPVTLLQGDSQAAHNWQGLAGKDLLSNCQHFCERGVKHSY